MSTLFDKYDQTYQHTVEQSVGFSGLKHNFFLKAKQNVLTNIIQRHFPNKNRLDSLDIGCGIGSLHPLLKKFTVEVVRS